MDICVQSLMLPSHIFLDLPHLLFPSTVPRNNSLEMLMCLETWPYHDSFLLLYSLQDWLLEACHIIDGLPQIIIFIVFSIRDLQDLNKELYLKLLWPSLKRLGYR